MVIFEPTAAGRDAEEIDEFVFRNDGAQAAQPDPDDDGGDDGDGDGGSSGDGGPDDWDPDGPYPSREPHLGLSDRSPSIDTAGYDQPDEFVGIVEPFAFDIFG